MGHCKPTKAKVSSDHPGLITAPSTSAKRWRSSGAYGPKQSRPFGVQTPQRGQLLLKGIHAAANDVPIYKDQEKTVQPLLIDCFNAFAVTGKGVILVAWVISLDPHALGTGAIAGRR